MSLDWEGIDCAVPLLMLPVRIETQTGLVDAAAPHEPVRLRVRIHPDDVALDRHSGRALLLPDAFIAVARVGDEVYTGEGGPVSIEHLRLGAPDGTPEERLEAMATSLGELTGPDREADAGTAWLRSFPAAADVGLGLTVELPPETTHVDSLVVLGVRSGRDPDEESAAVTAALRAHDADAGFLRPGDPTNSTEASRSAWSRPDPGAPEGPGEPPALSPTSAGSRLADAVGDPTAPLAHWPGADDPGEDWAAAMATGLWPVTWGAFLERSVEPGILDPDTVESVRRHHDNSVRGRGPLPLVRLGRQPYGVLPLTDLSRFVGSTPEVGRLAGMLERMGVYWSVGSRSVPSVTRAGAAALPEVLGQTPVSWGLRVRRLLDTGGFLTHLLSGSNVEQERVLTDITRAIEDHLAGAEAHLRSEYALRAPGQLGTDRTLGLAMVADDDPDALSHMADGAAPGTASVLQVLLGLALETVRASVTTRLTEDRGNQLLSSLDGGVLFESTGPDGAAVAREILSALITGEEGVGRAAEALELVDAFQRDQGHLARWTRPLAVLGPMFRDDSATSLLADLRALLRALMVRDEVTEAVRLIATITDPRDRLGLLAETLDCASHRYDAWVTSIATTRLAELRADRPTGIAVGAVGWVEDLTLERRPAPGDDSTPVRAGAAGAVLAPSLRHAATAAVLRGGRLAHAPGDEAGRALELDLSSTRTRQARGVLAGIRSGQELGALLGYRFERWLGDADPHLNRFVASLRTMAPSVLAKEVDRVAEGAVDIGGEAVAASQVVDGLRLLEIGAEDEGDVHGILTRLRKPPASLARYDAPWVPPNDPEKAMITTLLARLGELLDAVGDLLLAEGVHQLVAGNAARAAAAMDGLSGDGLPPDPEVCAPVADRRGLSHRVAVLLPPAADVAAGDGWAATPRARANPVLETWCRAVLGPATRIVLAPKHTVGQLGVGALDVVEASGSGEVGLRAFWARARRQQPGLPGAWPPRPTHMAASRSTIAEAWQLAASLRATLTHSRPAEPADLVHDPAHDPMRTSGSQGPVDPARVDVLVDLATELETLAQQDPHADPSRLADQLAAYGIGSDLAGQGTPPAPEDPDALLARVTAGLATAASRAAEVRRLCSAAVTAGDLVAATRELTGSELPVPLALAPIGADEPLGAAWGHGTAEGYAIRPWLARHARVRPALTRYTEVGMLRSATQRSVRMRAVTLHADTWHGEHLPAGSAPESALTSLVLEVPPDTDPGGAVCGLVLDTWHETMPRLRSLPDDTTSAVPEHGAAPPSEAFATAGLALHANGPDARAPQGLLLAVTPDREPWSADTVLGIVDRARELARMRLVTLERLPMAGAVLPALTVAHWSLQGERVLDPRLLSQLTDVGATPRFVRFQD